MAATEKEAETSDKIAARAFAQSYLADLVPSVFTLLSDNGYFHDPVEHGKLCCLLFTVKSCKPTTKITSGPFDIRLHCWRAGIIQSY